MNALFHVHNAITACLTQLSMNFDWFHATQVEESDNHALFFDYKRRHFSIKNTTATRPRHKHSTGRTVLPLGLAQPKEQPRLLQQLLHFYLLPFPRKKLGYLTTWTPHVCFYYWVIPRNYSVFNCSVKIGKMNRSVSVADVKHQSRCITLILPIQAFISV